MDTCTLSKVRFSTEWGSVFNKFWFYVLFGSATMCNMCNSNINFNSKKYNLSLNKVHVSDIECQPSAE